MAHSPRGTLGKCMYLAHIHQQPSKSFKPSVDVLPLARWFLSSPSVRQTPLLPAHQLAPSHPGGLGDPCSPGERPSMIRYAVRVQTSPNSCMASLTIQTFNTESQLDEHFQCQAYVGYGPLQQRTTCTRQ